MLLVKPYIWLDSSLKEIQVWSAKTTTVYLILDKKSTINLAKNPVSHGRSKHIGTQFHFLRDYVNKGKLEMVFSRTEEQVVDVLTKSLKIERFSQMRRMLGVVSLSDSELKVDVLS